jgi:hypothetical protein
MMKIKTRALSGLSILLIMILAVAVPVLSVSAAPSISISPLSGVCGTTVKVNGSAFGAYSGERLSVYFDNTEVTPYGVTVSAGDILQATFIVPDSAVQGIHSITVKGRAGTVLAESQFYIEQTKILLNRWSSTVGTVITASCRGFHAGKDVSVQYYSTIDVPETLVSQKAADSGECTMQFTVPASAAGRHQILAKNEFGDSAETDLDIIPSLSINSPVANVGDKVIISGTGFTASSEVAVTLHGNDIAFAKVSDRGSFNAMFYVPVIKAGTYSIAIQDASGDTKWIDFTVASKMTISASTGAVGLKLQVDGSGFEVGGLVAISYDTGEIALVTADNTGSFSVGFAVPVSLAGTHHITVTDGFNTKQADFTVESDPPPVPETYVPKPFSAVEAQVHFAWGSVFDPSEPVTYSLQIAATKDFSQPIVEKKGLSSSEYTLTIEESLRPNSRFTSYYWRVRATDSASNVGAWSEPIAFQLEPPGTLPQWADYTLIGIGFLMVIILVVRIRKGIKALKTTEKNAAG